MKKFVLLALLISTLFLMASPKIKLASAQEPIIFKVEPESYQALKKGETFTVNITINNVNASDRLVGVEFRLGYNDTLLEVVSVTEGPFFKQFGQTPNPPYTYFIYYIEPETQFPNGTIIPPHVLVGILLLPNSTGEWPGPMPEGNGTIAQITFKAIYQPVEPSPPANCILDLFQVRAVNDLKEQLPVEEEDGHYEIIPALYPIVIYEYSPLMPVAGQRVIFNASKSYDPDGEILWYLWEFEDGTKINTTNPVIIYTFLSSGENLVTLTVKDIDGLYASISKTIKVGATTPLRINIETGSLRFRGEICEYNILTTYLGRAVNSQLTATLYFNGNLYVNLTGNIQSIETGFYRIPYTIPRTAEAGTYTLLVKAEYNGISNMEIKSFYISDSLASMNATISSIQQDLANVVIPNLGIIKLNLTEVNATVTSIKENTVTINTSIGDLKSDIQGLNGSISGLNSTVKNTEDKVNEVKGTSNTILTLLYATLILAIIAIVAAVMATYFARKASK